MNNERTLKHRVTRVVAQKKLPSSGDVLAIEEPLEIRVAGDPMAVTMRTPGDDRQLALGFLFCEGIVSSVDDVGRIVHCGRPGTPAFGNTIDVLPAPGTVIAPERLRASKRGTLTTSACGLCGRERIDDLQQRCRPFDRDIAVSAGLIFRAMDALREGQHTFGQTGGVHAAAICSANGDALICCEDVGRHNAVDKAIGHLLFERKLPGAGMMLVVSGRASFEIVQKAAMARLPIVAAVSAPTSLAVDLAREMNMALLGFVRGDRLTIYTGEERIGEEDLTPSQSGMRE